MNKNETICPECDGQCFFRDIDCCREPLKDGSCCGNGVPVNVPCQFCGGAGTVSLESGQQPTNQTNTGD